MATYYVDGATGNDSTGTGTEVGPWATVQHAIDNSSNLDTIWVKNSVTYGESLTIPANTGRRLYGYSATIGDDGIAHFDGAATRTVGLTMSNTSGASMGGDGIRYRNLRFDNYTSHGMVYTVTGGDANNWNFVDNCRFSNNGGHGLFYDTSSSSSRRDSVTSCTFDGNTLMGFSGASNAFGCLFKNNGGNGVEFSATGYRPGRAANFCIATGNGGDGFDGMGAGTNCIAYNNTGDGFSGVAGISAGLLSNLIAQENGGYGFSGWDDRCVAANLVAYLNGTGTVNMTGAADAGWPSVTPAISTTDPNFTDAASDDFSTGDPTATLVIGGGGTTLSVATLAGVDFILGSGGGSAPVRPRPIVRH